MMNVLNEREGRIFKGREAPSPKVFGSTKDLPQGWRTE